MTKVIRFVKVTKKGSEGKCRPIEDINNLLNKGALHHTLEAIYDPPGPGEVESNCHNISIGLMTDLMINGLSAGYILVTTKNIGWKHSWLECEGWSIDASTVLKDPNKPEGEYDIIVGDAGDYRQRLGIRSFHIKSQLTDKEFCVWIVKQGQKERKARGLPLPGGEANSAPCGASFMPLPDFWVK